MQVQQTSKLAPWQLMLIGSGSALLVIAIGLGITKLYPSNQNIASSTNTNKQEQVAKQKKNKFRPKFMSNFFGQVAKARETEAKTSLGAMNRAQQAHHFENRRFANQQQLSKSLTLSPEFYTYRVDVSNKNIAKGAAIPNDEELRSFISGAYFSRSGTFSAVVCQSNEPNQDTSPSPYITGNSLQCPAGFTALY